MKKTLLAAVLLATPAAAATPTVSFTDAIAICRETFLANPDKGAAMFKALPEESKQSVALICLAYRQGALDLLDAANSKPVSRT